MRREMLGDKHVDRSLANRNDLTDVFQDLITRYAWGEIWTRPGLTRTTRSAMAGGCLAVTGSSARRW